MGYRTVDEFEHFDFKDAEVLRIFKKGGHIVLELAFVTIKGENSCNRDIRDMGARELCLQLQDASDASLIREGYNRYDADGNLLERFEDEELPEEELSILYEQLQGAVIYEAKKADRRYSFIIDSNDLEGEGRTWQFQVSAAHDVEEWEKFMNKNG